MSVVTNYKTASQAIKYQNYQDKKNNDQAILTRIGEAAKELTTLAESVGTVSAEQNYSYYLSSNEMFTEARRQLTPDSKICGIQPRCHFGFSTWHNFEIVGLRKSELAILADFSSTALKFLKKSIDLLKKCSTAQKFKEALLVESFGLDMPVKNMKYKQLKLYPEKAIENPNAAFEAELEMENWLKDPKIYKHIRKLALTDRIVLIRMDAFKDVKLFEQIRVVFNKHQMHLDTLYISNVINIIGENMDEKIDAFEGNVAKLADKGTQIIQSVWIETNMHAVKILKQFVHNDTDDLRRLFYKTEDASLKSGEIEAEKIILKNGCH